MSVFSSAFIVFFSLSVFVSGQNQYTFLESPMIASGYTLLSRYNGVVSRFQCASVCSQQSTCLRLRYCFLDGACDLYAACALCTTNASTCSGGTSPEEYMLTDRLPANSTAEKYLVTGQDGVPDSQLSESSHYYNDVYNISLYGKHARLNSSQPEGCWAPSTRDDNDDYVQVDFLAVRLATCVVLTGRARPGPVQFVTGFRVHYSADCVTFTPARDEHGNETVFDGCGTVTDVVTRCFQTPLAARCVRINPTTFKDYKCVRFDILGY